MTGIEGTFFIDKWGKMWVVEVYFVWVGMGGGGAVSGSEWRWLLVLV